MRTSRRITAAGAATLLTFAVGSSTVAVSAHADEVPTPVASSGATVGNTPVQAGSETEADVQAQASKGWSPGTEKDPDGKWTAYIEIAGGFVREEVGTYETRKEARKAAKAAADEANGVVAGPGCDSPLVLC